MRWFCQKQVDIARSQAIERGLTNLRFEACPVERLSSLGLRFDLIYFRFFLVHLSEPEMALNAMIGCLKPGGVLACDEQALSPACCYPEAEVFEQGKAIAHKATRVNGLDLDRGLKLYELLKSLHMNDIRVQAIQPALTDPAQKQLWPMSFEEARESFQSAVGMSDGDYDAFLRDTYALANDTDNLMLLMQNFQITAVI